VLEFDLLLLAVAMLLLAIYSRMHSLTYHLLTPYSLTAGLHSVSTMDKISASLSLMRRLPPNKIEQSLSGLLNLIPQETDELLQRVDQPLEEAVDPESVSE
jgi:hypothetical protein